MKLLLPFLAALLAGTALGQERTATAAEVQEAMEARRLRAKQPAVLPARHEARLFIFPGGTPGDYLAAVDKAMGSNLSEVATIPDGADRIRVPQIRAKLTSVDDAVSLFDSIGDINGQLGRWIMQKVGSAMPGGDDEVLSVVFVPPARQAREASLDVRAVSLRDIPETRWKEFAALLNDSINQQRAMMSKLGTPPQPFDLKIHHDSGMLIAAGGKEQVDRIETLSATMRESFVSRSAAGVVGVKARAFSVAGLPPETVKRLTVEIMERAERLYVEQRNAAEQSGAQLGAGVFIFGSPDIIESLQVMIVAGNSAGLEFAESLIEEVKRAMGTGDPGKFVIVDGAVDSRGSVPWTPKLTVLDAIAAAHGRSGNFGDSVRLTRDSITRILSYKEMKFDPAKNERLQPGDRIEMGALPKPAEPQNKP